jgi:hypothetical protein
MVLNPFKMSQCEEVRRLNIYVWHALSVLGMDFAVTDKTVNLLI